MKQMPPDIQHTILADMNVELSVDDHLLFTR